ncbi:MAG: nucleotide exchange factor GrpE [Candidatus Moraniibacteriota bacterium]
MAKKQEDKKKIEDRGREMVLTIKAVVVRDEREVLLLKRSKDQVNPGKYDLPGGRLEEGETIEEALKREVAEETGLEVEMGDILKATEFPKENKHFKEEKRGLRFIAYYKSGEVKLSEEHEDFEWVSFDEALEKVSAEDGFEMEKRETIEMAKDLIDLKNSYDGWRRALADMENLKKRTAKQNEEYKKYCLEDFVLDLLPVLDNFNLALDHVPDTEKKSGWVVGILHIKKQLEDVLTSRGVEEIPVKEGDKIDTNIHEVVSGKEGKEEGEKVKKVLKKGYKMEDRIVRPAIVESE